MRNALPTFIKMAERFAEKCNFVMVYLMEAHAADEWPLGTKVTINQHKTNKERIDAATDLKEKYKINFPLVVDGIENTFHKTYAAWPERYFIVDKAGKLAHIAVPGPMGYTSAHIDQVQEWLENRCL